MHAIYRNVVFDNVSRPASPEDIASLEVALGASLPRDVVEFLSVVNGADCAFSMDVTLADGSSRNVALQEWYGVEGPTTFEHALDFVRETFQVPREVLPIANSNAQHFFFVDLTEQGGGRVVAFVQGQPGWTGRNTAPEFVTVANSLMELLDELSLDDDTVEMLQEELGNDEEEDQRIERILDVGRPGWRAP
ncbi:SMI1/KNR4 family protein [Deinococcus pimensis]|uniref:SMI1/KNR4 family protein n=1 Tax=Deinococcus pimensis TaxID=309888 RepID=UPI0004819DA6|nr:SMI1/KNR4 family protein [Deinococcus pimensis]